MFTNRKLKQWIEDHGLKQSFVAKKINVTQSILSQICTESISIPKRVWRNVITFTDGNITMDDFVNEMLDEYVSKIQEKGKGEEEKSLEKSEGMVN